MHEYGIKTDDGFETNHVSRHPRAWRLRERKRMLTTTKLEIATRVMSSTRKEADGDQ